MRARRTPLLTRPGRCRRCSALKDSPECPDALRVFTGRRVVPVLAGRIIRPMAEKLSPQQLVEEWREASVSLLLPGGDALAFGDACFQGAPFAERAAPEHATAHNNDQNV